MRDAVDVEAAGPNVPRVEGPPNPTCPIHLAVMRDGEDGFSALALNLPGAGSCGDTEEEAIANVKDAVRTLMATYAEMGDPIPWKDTSDADVPAGAALGGPAAPRV